MYAKCFNSSPEGVASARFIIPLYYGSVNVCYYSVFLLSFTLCYVFRYATCLPSPFYCVLYKYFSLALLLLERMLDSYVFYTSSNRRNVSSLLWSHCNRFLLPMRVCHPSLLSRALCMLTKCALVAVCIILLQLTHAVQTIYSHMFITNACRHSSYCYSG